ncbi:hypothetical protein JCM19239_6062 [Vibrio variabilis]|uniref:Uncharacterized protein n=1 Tax=Vibrio variabilis TaxID=990271 RepID=A0ABQ0JLT3_9VIBR|nr:hypothetical protein JCM19239_6062 [Vibrio variabilis]
MASISVNVLRVFRFISIPSFSGSLFCHSIAPRSEESNVKRNWFV